MRAQLLKPSKSLPQGDGWIYELKYDGFRCLAFVDGGKVRLVSRNQNDFDVKKYKATADALIKLTGGKGVVLDGELLAYGSRGFMVFDILQFDGEDLRKLPLIERKKKLEQLFKSTAAQNISQNIHLVDYMEKFTQSDFDKLCTGNYEGIVAKRKSSIYSGVRTSDWLKVKCENYSRVSITSPDKIVFTDPDITKQQIVDYYVKIAPKILPYIQNRNLALIKCPSGVEKNCFYNKNQNDELITISSVDDLIFQVQNNTIEFHVWGSQVDSLEKPDVMVFDLDPDEGMNLDQIRQGVRDLKGVLVELGLKPHLKTSGGKGYHVVVDFTPSMGWEEFRGFAKNVATVMEQKWGDRYTTNIRKQNRKGKIFIDWIRNTRGATSVAAYSLRAKPNATISCPIAWEDLDKIAPDGVNIFNVNDFGGE